MAIRKGDTAMKAALEAALKEIVADGSYKKLIENLEVPSVGVVVRLKGLVPPISLLVPMTFRSS